MILDYPLPRYIVDPDSRDFPELSTDILIVGGGIAGLTAAIAASEQGKSVVVITKDSLEESNSFYAQGGIAAVLHVSDSISLHMDDTLRVGDGLSDAAIVEIVVREGPEAINRLIRYGSVFDRENGDLALSREGGHSAPRVVHTRDSTGMEIQRVLISTAKSLDSTTILERNFALDLITRAGRCFGALVWNEEKGFLRIAADCTILTSGGAGQIYRETTNPAVATGDGVSMAFRAGAQVRDLEFFQFHPTVLYLAGTPRMLISETARGEGGILRDKSGLRFMPSCHPQGELAPRDVVSRSILEQMARTQHSHVFLDMTHLDADFLRNRFPGICEACSRHGIDVSSEPIPVRPAAHYMIGGVEVDRDGRSSLHGLYACGEVASSRLHGANRLGSNSLLEGVVFGWRSALAAAGEATEAERPATDQAARMKSRPGSGSYHLDVEDLRNSLKALMWRNVGIKRTDAALINALEKIDTWCRLVLKARLDTPAGWELTNMLTLARLITRSALERNESRGVHFRTDYPDKNDLEWRDRTVSLIRGSFERETP